VMLFVFFDAVLCLVTNSVASRLLSRRENKII
jgi:hypothetical protein